MFKIFLVIPFSDLCRHVNLVQDCQSNYTVLVSGISKFIRQKKYGPQVCCRFVELIGSIAEVCTLLLNDKSFPCGSCLNSLCSDVKVIPIQFLYKLL